MKNILLILIAFKHRIQLHLSASVWKHKGVHSQHPNSILTLLVSASLSFKTDSGTGF